MTDPCCSPSRPRSTFTSESAASASRAQGQSSAQDVVPIAGGRFSMGTDDGIYPGDHEGPARSVEVGSFSIGAVVVTNQAFRKFVAATGHVTDAERFGWSFVFSHHLPTAFEPTRGVAGADWWRQVFGADWAHPAGPQSDVLERDDHPVVHVSFNDAQAFCDWDGSRLPTEPEWEKAARGGLSGATFPWGDEREPDGAHRMNVWQGDFPLNDTGEDGHVGVAPVRSYEPNGLGVFEATGNVWEWCDSVFDSTGAMRVMKGGSYLCHESYCQRYRVAARSANAADSSADNVGFRVAVD